MSRKLQAPRGTLDVQPADAQRRLALLGHPLDEDPGGEYGPATESATKAFQLRRGLPEC